MDNVDPVNYIRVRIAVTKYIKHKKGGNFIIRPVMPVNIHIVNTCSKRCKRLLQNSGTKKIVMTIKCEISGTWT